MCSTSIHVNRNTFKGAAVKFALRKLNILYCHSSPYINIYKKEHKIIYVINMFLINCI